MASGSYFPPAVKEVEIPKRDGRVRKLGIPTISDRVAQMIVKDYLETRFENISVHAPMPAHDLKEKKVKIIRKKLIYLHKMQINMKEKAINRLKAVLAEQGKTNKWLAEKLSKNETTISRWCTNEVQPSMENLVAIAKLLEVDVKELINSTRSTK